MPFEPDNSTTEPLACSAVLTHHWLVRRRGGERVLEALGELLPASPIYTLVHDAAGLGDWPLASRAVRTSWLQYLPGARRHYPKLLPLMPSAARAMKLPPVDLVMCSDAAIAKAMTVHPRSKLVCYCHSPMRYVWDLAEEYRRTLPAPLRPLWGPLCRLVQKADQRAARRVDLFVANSVHVAGRIRRSYGAEAVVVYPPVDVPPAPARGKREDYYLAIGYHVAYKRLDLAVEACRQLGRRLVVIGDGPDLARIEQSHDRHVGVLGWQPTEIIRDHLCRARAVLFPGEEDFGIVPVEAMGFGCPVVAYGVGGAAETVLPDQTGVLFRDQTTTGLADAMRRCEKLRFDPTALHAQALRFRKERFLQEMRAVLESVLGD